MNSSVADHKKNSTDSLSLLPDLFRRRCGDVFTCVELYPALLEYFECRREFNLVIMVLDPVFVVTIHLLQAVLRDTMATVPVQLQAKTVHFVKATSDLSRTRQWRPGGR